MVDVLARAPGAALLPVQGEVCRSPGSPGVGSINVLLYRFGPFHACTVRCLESAHAIPQGVRAHGRDCYRATPPPPAAALQMAPGNDREVLSRESLRGPSRDQRSSPSLAGEHAEAPTSGSRDS